MADALSCALNHRRPQVDGRADQAPVLELADGFEPAIASEIAQLTGHAFESAPNKFAAQGDLDAVVAASGGVRSRAFPFMKIANDIRWLASGPRGGISELVLLANEPGSSIMPGKVNPSSAKRWSWSAFKSLRAVASPSLARKATSNSTPRVRSSSTTFCISSRILGDACTNLRQYCIEGTQLHREQVDTYVERSLMLVTALSPVIGYDKASAIAHKANDNNTTPRQAALASGYITEVDFDRIVDPRKMVGSST